MPGGPSREDRPRLTRMTPAGTRRRARCQAPAAAVSKQTSLIVTRRSTATLHSLLHPVARAVDERGHTGDVTGSSWT